MKVIGKDLGIVIPKKYKIIKSDSDPFGPPGDQEITYIFKFDSLAFKQLTNNIRKSPLYNVTAMENYVKLPKDKKLQIITTLSQKQMLSFWAKTDSSFVYNGNHFFINDVDRTLVSAAIKNIYLPNYDSTDFSADGYTPRIVYYVEAVVDIKKRTLYYNYIHP